MRWTVCGLEDVPEDDRWLGDRERAVLVTLEGRRREEWRLGRWAAKTMLDAGVEILPAADGAPEAWRGAQREPVHVSLGHRRGRALAVVAPHAVGCDLEPLRDDRDVLGFVAWEAAAKALRRPLLADRHPRVELEDQTFTVRFGDGTEVGGRLWVDGGWAFAIASAP